jgi:hypothetical protein
MLWAAQNQIQLAALDARSPSLESVFLSIADGRALDAVDTAQIEEGSLR